MTTHAQHAADLFAAGHVVVIRAHGLPGRQFGRVLKVFATGGLLVRCMTTRTRPVEGAVTSTRRVRASDVFHVLDSVLTGAPTASADAAAAARVAMGDAGYTAAMTVLELASAIDDTPTGYARAWEAVVANLATLGAITAPTDCRSGQIVAALHRYAVPVCVPSRVEAVEAVEAAPAVEAPAIARPVACNETPEALAAWAALEELETARAAEAARAVEPVELVEARALVDDDANDAVARDRKGLAWGLRDAADGFAGLASWRHLAASVETVEGWILVNGRRVHVEGDRDEMRSELSARAARLAGGEAAQ